MPMTEGHEFDASMLPGVLKKETRELIEVAATLGWKVHLTSNKSVTIISPVNPRKKYHFGQSGRATTSMNRMKRDVLRFGDPGRVAAVGMAVASGDSELQSIVATALDRTTEMHDDTPQAPSPKDRKEPARGEAPEAEVAAATEEPQARIVSEKPMLARQGTSRAYDSPTTIERRWSDGSRDYRCTVCDFTSPDRLPVSRHYSGQHSKGKGPEPKSFKADVPGAARYRPRRSRVTALAQAILAALEGRTVDEGTVEEIALQALTWVHEQTQHGTEHASEHESMTAEETLDRIRLLLDDGSNFRIRETLEQREEQVVALEQRLSSMQEEVDAARKDAEDARTTLRAFAELAREVDNDEAG